ncbi:MAG: hypothetical protein PHV82_09565 [Victivallaceae bacterium]|nr:hypothetical protein [Victivallaceae bacterium]
MVIKERNNQKKLLPDVFEDGLFFIIVLFQANYIFKERSWKPVQALEKTFKGEIPYFSGEFRLSRCLVLLIFTLPVIAYGRTVLR